MLLDDRTLFRVLSAGFTKEELFHNWQPDIDEKGMVRATRCPLGEAAKLQIKTGDVDLDGDVVEDGEQGQYYAWYQGIHMLPGAEGKALYEIRPSHEKRLDKNPAHFRLATRFNKVFGFKKSFKALLQEDLSRNASATDGADDMNETD